ncbi:MULTISPECIES: WGR domain-containing protein [unclassified Bradyrhizobium]|uniref:WGR domain-containing protein n=1 Tax=unclassified Bradyrhizobium TaxID=2631580 RepID=UPI002916E351|nr:MULTISPECIES: WGR domain-containing protein [unclassified Bradyrhizobium]
MTRTDDQRNMARFYKPDVQPELFGKWSSLKEWERIGRGGTANAELHATRGLAHMALIAKRSEKRKRGYQ